MKFQFPAIRCVPGVLLLSLARLSADAPPLTPGLGSATGLAGQQSSLTWSSQPGVRYRVEKSTGLAADGSGAWSTRAIVEATGTTTKWVDPEAQGERAFYRVPQPRAEVFQVVPPVLSSGGVLWLDAQCLPPGCSAVFEIEGLGAVSAPVITGPDGRSSVTLPPLPPSSVGARVISARLVDGAGATVVTIGQQLEITATGVSSNPGPVLPPIVAAVVKSKTKSNQSNDRKDRDEDCDGFADTDVREQCDDGNDRDPDDARARFPRLSPRMALAAVPLAPSSKRSEAELNLNAIEKSGARPGTVTLHRCDLSVPTPAGPPMEWIRTYTSRPTPASSDAPPQFDFAWNARIVPVPLAAGTSAPRIYLFGGDGRRDVMVRQPDGSYTCDGMFRSGRFNADTSFTLTFADQTKMIFCPLVGAPWQGRLGSLVDSNGVAVSCTYTAGGQLNTVTSQFGQSFTCTYGADGRLSKVTDHTGRFVSYTYYSGGEAGGNPGDLKSVSCVQKPGEAPLAGPTTYTYTTGNADDALNHNLLTVTDGRGTLRAGFIYATDPNFRSLSYDVCVATDFDGSGTAASPPLVYSYQPSSSSQSPGSYRVTCNDPSGRVTEFTYSASHDCIACRQFTGFSTPGIPVTDGVNYPTGKLRASDPDSFDTTWLYNGQHLCTRETLPNSAQHCYSLECDLHPGGPPLERANVRVITLRSPDGEERSITCDYLPGFGTTEGVWAGEDGNGGCTDRRVPIRNLGSSGQDGVDVNFGRKAKHRGWDGLIYHRYLSKKGYDYYRNLSDFETARVAGGTGTAVGGDGPDPVLSSNPIPGVGVVIKRNGPVKHKRVAGGGGSVWPGEDGDGGCTDDPTMLARGTNPDGSDCTNKGRPKLGSAMLSSGGIIHLGCGGGSGIGGNLRPGSPIGGLSIKGGRNHPTRITTSLGQVFTWSYDLSGNCVAERTPVAGAGCDATYNALGQCTSLTVLNGPGSSFTQTCTYHPVTGWLTSHIVDPAGLHLTTTFEADALGQVIRCVDPLGNDWLTDYNTMGCVTRTRSPLAGSSRVACDYFYDQAGDVARYDLEHRDETGALATANPAYTTFIVRDNRGRISRLACEQRPVNVTVIPPALTPDAFGLENFDIEDYTFNSAGECVRISTPAACRGMTGDAACDFQFDERGLLYRCVEGGTGSMSTVSSQLDYDSNGAIVRVSLLPSSSAGAAGEPLTSTFTWDGFHRLRTCTCPMGNVYVYDYDTAGGVTCSLFGEVTDVPGQAGNVLLARGTSSCLPDGLLYGSGNSLPLGKLSAFCRCSPGYTTSRERFAPGEPGPHEQEVTTVNHSPAGLVTTIVCNGDILLSCTHDTAARPATCSDGSCLWSCVRDACGAVISCTRTDLSSIAGQAPKSYTTTCTLDVFGRVISATAGGGNTVTKRYDSLHRITGYTMPSGTIYRCLWDGVYADGTGTVSPYTQLVEADPTGTGQYQTLRRITCNAGYSISGADSYGHVTSIELDTLNRPVVHNYPDGTHEFIFADSYGRFTMCLHRDGTMTVADLDADGRLSRLSRFGTPAAVPVAPVEYIYSGTGCPVSITQGDSTIACTWDSLGNQLSEKHNGYGVTRTFNHRGRTGVAYSDGTRFAETRNHLGLLLSVSALNSAGVVLSPPLSSIQYSGHNPSSETRRNGVTTTWEYRGDGDAPLPGGGEDYSFDTCVRTVCTAGNGNVFHSTRVRRDRNQCPTVADTFFASGATAPGRRRTQTWDRLGRLVSCTIQRREVAGGPLVTESSVSYTLDLEGRRLTATGGSNPGVYTQNAAIPPADRQAGQYSSWPGGALLWDDDGCLTSMSSSAGSAQFVYDAASRLVAVNDAGTGAPVATYAYDAVGRRTRSSTGGSAGLPPVTTYFVYDGPRCVQELGGDGLPNVTMPAAEAGGFAICITSRNGTLVYPHGGGGGNTGGSTAKWNYPILPADIVRMKEIEIEEPVLQCFTVGGGGVSHGGGGAGGMLGLGMKKFDWAPKLEGGKEGLAVQEPTAVLGFACTAGAGGGVVERLDGSDGGEPIFLTSDGLPRPGATGTLSGCNWFAREGSKVVWSPRSNIDLYGRYCPETGMLQCHDGTYSPQLGTAVSKPKKGQAFKATWDLATGKK